MTLPATTILPDAKAVLPEPLRRLAVLVAWSFAAFIIYATLSPLDMRPRIGIFVDLERFGAFAVLGTLFALAHPRQRVAVILFCLVLPVGLEIFQALSPDRHARWSDTGFKLAGSAFGLWAGWFLLGRLAVFRRSRGTLNRNAKISG